VVEREGDDEGQQLLAITNFVNDNESLSYGFGIASPGSNEREDIKEPSNNFIEEENLNYSNSKVGESLGEDLNVLAVDDCIVSSELGHSKSPNHSICHCSLSNKNAAGGGNSRSVEKVVLGQKPKAISPKGGSKGGSRLLRGGESQNSVCVDNVCRRPKSFVPLESIKGGKENQAGGGIRSGVQKDVAGSKDGSIPISSKNNNASAGNHRGTCDQTNPKKLIHKARAPATTLPPRANGVPSVSTKRRSSIPVQSISESSLNASMAREGV
ncbi:hypothetical protein L195_g046682, partial [Trifolium pratense]